MVTVPAATPVTSPREETVAMSSSELAQGDVVAGFPDPVSVVVASTHTLVLPLMVGDIQISVPIKSNATT